MHHCINKCRYHRATNNHVHTFHFLLESDRADTCLRRSSAPFASSLTSICLIHVSLSYSLYRRQVCYHHSRAVTAIPFGQCDGKPENSSGGVQNQVTIAAIRSAQCCMYVRCNEISAATKVLRLILSLSAIMSICVFRPSSYNGSDIHSNALSSPYC